MGMRYRDTRLEAFFRPCCSDSWQRGEFGSRCRRCCHHRRGSCKNHPHAFPVRHLSMAARTLYVNPWRLPRYGFAPRSKSPSPITTLFRSGPPHLDSGLRPWCDWHFLCLLPLTNPKIAWDPTARLFRPRIPLIQNLKVPSHLTLPHLDSGLRPCYMSRLIRI